MFRLVKTDGYAYSGGGGLYPNMFCAHPPFQIDGNFGYVSAIVEMLMQCYDGEMVLLPALPKEFASSSVKGFVAEGGKEVSFKWKNGMVEN